MAATNAGTTGSTCEPKDWPFLDLQMYVLLYLPVLISFCYDMIKSVWLMSQFPETGQIFTGKRLLLAHFVTVHWKNVTHI